MYQEVTRTNRFYFAVLTAVLLLLPVFTLVPSLFAATPAAFQETTLDPVNAERTDVELDMMYFTPSVTIEDGIYYVARRGVDTIAYFGESEVYYVAGDTCLRLDFPGSASVVPVGEKPTGSVTNYIYGNDPGTWRTGLMDFGVLRYVNLYPGIDLVYRFLDGSLKYEFVVAPHADPCLIQMRYPDSDTVEVTDDSLAVSKDEFTVVDTGLTALQRNPSNREVACTFLSRDSNIVMLSTGWYDTSCELVVDPIVLAYSTYLGGSSIDRGLAIAVDNGSIYVVGLTESSDFPTACANDSTHNGFSDCFVTKFAADGQLLVYSTFLGGASQDAPLGIAVEKGSAYVTGYTSSSDFPTVNAYNSTFSGLYDCFLTKLAENGASILYSTYLGGASYDYGRAIAVENRSSYVMGYTASSDFPTVNGYDSTYNGGYDCFVTKFAADGQSLVYSTFLGGAAADIGWGVAVENGSSYVVGYTSSSDFPTVNAYDSTCNGGDDCFVTKFAADGQLLVYSTFVGGSGNDYGYGIAVENGSAYFTGYTQPPGVPTINALDSTFNGGQDCFVTKLSADGLSLVYSTFLGGPSNDRGNAIAVENGFAYVTGYTSSSDFFPTVAAVDSTHNGLVDCFVTMLAVDGQSLVYSTFLGGSGNDYGTGIAVENGSAYVTGYTDGSDFPTVAGYQKISNGMQDAFTAVISGDIDTDMDSLSDRDEAYYGTNRFCIDSDNDNFLDGYEVAYGSDPLDPMSYPGMPQSWYDAIYDDLDGNATLIQQVISWLDGNHTAIQTLFTFLEGNATLLVQTVNAVDGNSTQLDLLAALVTQDIDALNALNATHIGDVDEIRAVLDLLGVTVGDTDYDGLDDLDEITLGTDIQCIDTDCDNLNDAYEVKIGTDPTDDDTDDDTYYDGAEVLAGSDPLDPLDYPGSTITTTTTTGPATGIELIIVAVAAGAIGLVALLVVMRRRVGTRAST